MDVAFAAGRTLGVWDIVRVDFPFADEARTRRRPALVIAHLPATERFSIVWTLMITSATRGVWPGDVPVTDLDLGGLPRPSMVRSGKVAALDARLVERIGALSEGDRGRVAACVREALGVVLLG